MPEQPVAPEVIISALKRQEKPLHEAAKEGTTIQMGRGKQRAEMAMTGEQIWQTLRENATRKIIVERSRKMVPDRMDSTKPPTPEEIKNVEQAAEDVEAQISEQEHKRKETFTEIAKRIGPTKLEARMATYAQEADERVNKQLAASERGFLANEIKNKYADIAKQEFVVQALAKLPAVEGKPDKRGRVIPLSPKEQFVRLLSSDALTEGEKVLLRDTLQSSLSDFSNQFIGNEVVQRFQDSLREQWKAPEQSQSEEGEEQRKEESGETKTTESVEPADQSRESAGVDTSEEETSMEAAASVDLPIEQNAAQGTESPAEITDTSSDVLPVAGGSEDDVSQEVRDRWYEGQVLVDTTDMLDPSKLESLVEDCDPLVAEAMKDPKMQVEVQGKILTMVKERGADVADKIIANEIAKELASRITDGGKDVGYNVDRDIMQDFYQRPRVLWRQGSGRSIPKSPQEAVSSTYSSVDKNSLLEMYRNPDQIGMEQLVGFLHNPANFLSTLERSINEQVRESRHFEKESSLHAADRLKKRLSKVLIRGTQFLAEQADHPDGKYILGKEFGLSALPQWDNDTNRFTEAHAMLRQWFGNENGQHPESVVAQQTGQTLYDQVHQEEEPKDILSALPEERKKAEAQALENFSKAVTAVLERTQQEVAIIDEKGLLEVNQSSLSQEVKAQNDKITQESNKAISRWKVWDNEDKKDARVNILRKELDKTKAQLGQVNSRLAELSTVDKLRRGSLTDKAQRIDFIASVLRMAA